MTKSVCRDETPYYAQCIIVDENVRVNMHQRSGLKCGRGLDYHAKRKTDHDPDRNIFIFLPDPKDNEIKGEITKLGHHTNVFCMV